MDPRPSRTQAIAAARERGERIAAVLPIHYPRELLRAHGIHPVELWGPAGIDPTLGNAHLQAYACPIVRHATAFLHGPAAELVDLVLVPHACDALQGMGSVLRDFATIGKPVLTFYPPRGRRPADVDYLVNELHALADALVRAGGHRADTATLMRAVDEEEEADEAMRQLLAERHTIALDDAELYRLLRAREYLSASELRTLAAAAPRGRGAANGRVGVGLSGIVPDPPELFRALAEAGAQVVADDLAAVGRRVYPRASGTDPYRRMAERLLGGPPDWTRGIPIEERTQHLVRLLRERGAKGLIVHDPTFCEPELFDLPLLREALAGEGMGFLHLEVDMTANLSQQLVTRIEAFVEGLR